MPTPTQAKIGYGFILSFATTIGGSYTPIGAILELKPGKISVANVKIERNDSPDLFGEKIFGWKDVSDWEVKVTYDKTQSAVLNAQVGVMQYWKFTRPDGTMSLPFQAGISELGEEVPLKDQMTSEFKLTVSGGQTLS